jgi:signal transduction histidine kinase/ligand-binding sensor domain-containing protein/AraC-like DNA-binding protein
VAANCRFEWLSDKDGLSQNTVRCIMQDGKGFLWLGTTNGLNRYNGKEFIVMLPQTGNFASISDNRVRSLKEDRNGYIWVRTTSNIYCCYDPGLERFVDYDPQNRQKNFSHLHVFSNGDVWLWGRDGGCCRVRHTANGLQSKQFGKSELGSQTVSFVYEDARHQVWIGTDSGLFRLKDDLPVRVSSESFTSVHEYRQVLYFINDRHIVSFDSGQFGVSVDFSRAVSLNMTTSLNDGLILLATKENILLFDSRKMQFIPSEPLFNNQQVKNSTLYTDNKGNKWLYNHSGSIWRYTGEHRFEKIDLIPPPILSTIDSERYEIYHDSRDIIWITTYGNGLFSLDPNTRQIQHYTMNNSDLPTNHLLCVTEDKSGEIWVGTEFAGVSKISLSNYPVQILYPAQGDSHNRSNAVRLIYEDSQGRFWVGTRSGYLHLYDSYFRKIQSHKIAGGLPFCMKEDSQGNLWLGTRGNGVVVFPPSGEAPVRNYHLQESRQYAGSNNIFDILLDSKNRMWLATFGGGLFYADLNKPEVVFRHVDFQGSNHNQDMTRVIIEDRNGLIWVGTNEGVKVFDPDKLLRNSSRYISFRFDVNDDRTINNNEVKAIYEDRQGRIWLGTTGGGLNLLMMKEPLEHSLFKHYTSKDGLSNDVIQAIIEDDKGYIWVSTEGGSGISRFNLATERFENFSFSNSKQAGLFNEDACWKRKNGELMFGGYSGIFIFDPAKIKYDTYTPPVVITGLKINGEYVRPEENNSPLKESITISKTICLKHNQNSFNLEFAMLNFYLLNFNQYACYLEGYEKTWNPVTRYNVAAYRNVHPGTYLFKVKGCNSFGAWTENETVLEIVIEPPFWKSVWAYMIYIVLLLVAIYFSVRIVVKINRLHTEVEIERQLTDYKLRFFTNISHEFRTPLTIIRGSIENLISMENLPLAATKQIHQMAKSSSRLLRLIEQLLAFRKLQNKRLELKLERTEAVAFFYDIYQMFEELAKKKNISFRFESDCPQKETLLDKSIWDKIAYNLLSNAMKHTPDNGTIEMRLVFSEPDDRMVLSVSDSGPGVPKEKQNSLFVRFAQIDSISGGTGVGLHLTAELATVHKGKAEYAPSELGGACFSVSAPLSDDNYANEEIIETAASVQSGEMIDGTKLAEDLPESLPVNKKYLDYTILIIEDDDEVREFIYSQLNESFTMFLAKNGVEGLEKAIKEQPNLIICDVMMPGIDGFEVTRRLKEDFLTSHIPIILLTAHSSEEYQLEGIRAGSDAYITKPFSTKYLMLRIVKLIEQREKLQQKFAQSPGFPVFPIKLINKDKEILDKMHELIETNIENFDFSVEAFAKTMGMGRTLFYKKIKGITGYPPKEYLNIIRMKKAAELLATTSLNISEISYKVGIKDPFYFTKCFKAQFGKTPRNFRKNY